MNIENFSVETHQGPFLNVNEDDFHFDFDNELYMIFDGFGGAGIGDKAVENLKHNLISFYKNFVKDRNSTLPFFYSSKYLLEGNALINAALNSHQELYLENIKKPISERAGSSAILAVQAESVLTFLSTGNCRAYLHRKGRIYELFKDDSFQFLSHDHFNSHLKNIPLSGFGLFKDFHYQIKEVRISEGDKFLFLTDGVYGRIEEEEVEASLLRPTVNIKSKITDLFTLANRRGNLDNQTCMIIEF